MRLFKKPVCNKCGTRLPNDLVTWDTQEGTCGVCRYTRFMLYLVTSWDAYEKQLRILSLATLT